MQSDNMRDVRIIEMTTGGIANRRTKLVDRVSSRHDRCSESSRRIAALRRLLDDEDDLAHAFRLGHRATVRRLLDSVKRPAIEPVEPTRVRLLNLRPDARL